MREEVFASTRCVIRSGAGCSQPLANHASHGKTTESELANTKRIGESNHITAQKLDGAVVRRDIGRPMATRIVAQNAEMGEQIAGLHIPHPVIAA